MNKPTALMHGKTVLITGATAGIGEVTALELARSGATVVGVGRNPAKCATVADRIRAASGNPDVAYLVADLSVKAQVRRLAQELQTKYSRLDVLVNNAGAIYMQRQESADGIELTLALNHLSPFLLTDLLLGMLKASAPARIVTVSSGAHRMGQINFDDLEGKRQYGGWRAYSQSKLANILFSYELARRLDGSNVTANALHPGFVASNFALNNAQGIGGRFFAGLMKVGARYLGRTSEVGAETSIFLASSPTVDGVTGKYFLDMKAVPSSPISYDSAVARRLWEVSEEMVKG